MRGIYPTKDLEAVEQVFDSVHSDGLKSGGFNGLKCKEAVELIPEVKSLVGKAELKDHETMVLDSVAKGMEAYRRQHGALPTADLVKSALRQGQSCFEKHDSKFVFDSIGSTAGHDSIGTMPNRVQVAIIGALAEAVPFANYLPSDIGSNEFRSAIVSHAAGSLFGDYTLDETLDGINGGDVYLASERTMPVTLSVGRDTGTAAFVTYAGGATTFPVLRGRTIIHINGFFAAAEAHNNISSTATSSISGVFTIAGTDYSISGTVTIATGAVALAFAPALPVGTSVVAEVYLDYEKAPTLTPKAITKVSSYCYFASPWRHLCEQTIDTQTQYLNELGLDLLSESTMAGRNQMANERHYNALRKVKELSAGNTQTFDFDGTNQIAQKTRSQIIADIGVVAGIVDQQMAEDTLDHGVTHWYIGKKLKALIEALPSEVFESAGLTSQPGIFRVGRLWGKIDVYYTPKLITETSTSTQIICIGRSIQPARCPIVMGDAVSPIYTPIPMNSSMVSGQSVYARSFTAVNKHQPSARGCALINITNMV